MLMVFTVSLPLPLPLTQDVVCCIDQDLSYGEILAGRPGAWVVNFFYMHAIKKV